MRRTAVIASLVAILVTLTPHPASACSCAIPDLREGLRMFDGAFVGEFVSRRGSIPAPTSTFTFRVERALKGDIGEVIEVESSSHGASCGLEPGEGERIGLFVEGGSHGWWSNRCMQVNPDLLIDAAGPLPSPDGQGPVRFLVGADSVGYRMLGLDANGRTLAYGSGEGGAGHISVCPDARLAIEITSGGMAADGHRVAVRDLHTFEVVREVALHDHETDVWDASCRDPTAWHALVLVSDWPQGSNRGHLLNVTPDGAEKVIDLSMRAGRLTDEALFVITPNWKLVEIDPDSGKTTELARVPRNTWSFEVSPDARLVAGLIFDHDAEPGDAPVRIFVRELDGDGSIVSVPLDSAGIIGTFVWVDEETVVFTPWGGWATMDHALVLTSSLETVGRIVDWRAPAGVVRDGILYGTRNGHPHRELVAARLPDGVTDVLRTFDSPNVGQPVVVPDSTGASSSAAPAGAAAPASSSPWGFVVALLLGAAALLGMRRAGTAARSVGEPSREIGSLPE
jgi:hypothetical protein